MLKQVSKNVVLSIAASVVITGCSVAPQPMLQEDVKAQVKKDLSTLSEAALPVTKPITLDEAIYRGINHNLQKRVKVLESALSEQQLDLVYYDMLPSLTAAAGYSERNNYAASQSASFTNGKPQPLNNTYSISQEKERSTTDVTFSWNILDFGLSYVRAEQQADKFLIAKEKEKKIEHTLTQEIRRAYYQAVSAQDLLKRIQPMMVEVKQALNDSKAVQDQRVSKTPMEALAYQRELLDILRSLHTLESGLISAKVELSELMGLKPGTEFELADKVEKNYEIPQMHLSLDQMEEIALENRPELTESRYQERISEKELTAAKLKMLPGVNLSASLSYDNSDYLLNNDWYSYGANVSWNLLNVFKASSYNKLAKTQIEVAKEQKLALSMAVLSQVHLSIVNFNQAKKEYLLAKEYLTVADDIYRLTEVENSVNVNSRLILIKEKLNNILATLRYSAAYANVQNGYGKIFASLGVDEKALETPNMEPIQAVQAPVEEVKPVAEVPEEKLHVTPVVVPEVQETQAPIVEAKPVAETKEETLHVTPVVMPEVKETQAVEVPQKTTLQKEENRFSTMNFRTAKVLLYPGEKLMVNAKPYSVKEGDSLPKIAEEAGVSPSWIVSENPWLVEKNRVSAK